MARKSKSRRRKIFRKELPVSWSKGGHKADKVRVILDKSKYKDEE